MTEKDKAQFANDGWIAKSGFFNKQQREIAEKKFDPSSISTSEPVMEMKPVANNSGNKDS